jgi:hypothetical protein
MFIVIFNIFGWSVFDRFVHDDQKIRRIIIHRAYYTSQREVWIIMRGFRSTVTKFIFNALPLEKSIKGGLNFSPTPVHLI